MSGVEWLGTTALVGLAIAVVAMLTCVGAAIVASQTRDAVVDARAGRVGKASIFVALVAACITAGCAVLLVGNLAIAALLTLAT